MYEVIKNVKMPELKRGSGALYPFAKLKVGDGFDAPRDMGKGKNGSDKRQMSIASSARRFVKKSADYKDWKFVTRLLDDKTVRCARVR